MKWIVRWHTLNKGSNIINSLCVNDASVAIGDRMLIAIRIFACHIEDNLSGTEVWSVAVAAIF